MTNGHLTDRDVAEWLADESAGSTQDANVVRHVAECEHCRLRIDRGDSMLDLAAELVNEPDAPSRCPEAIQLAGYIDGTLGKPDNDNLRMHFGQCAVCSDLIERIQRDKSRDASDDMAGLPRRARSGVSRRIWLAGSAFLVAAAIAFVFLLPKSLLVALDVDILAAGNTRSADSPASGMEFEVKVRLQKPAWMTLLVVDATGEITFLEDRHSQSATLGRFGTTSPVPANAGATRKFVIVLVSPESLKSKLAAIDIEPVAIGEDAQANAIVMAGICKSLSSRLDCDAHYKPIAIPDSDE